MKVRNENKIREKERNHGASNVSKNLIKWRKRDQ